MKHWIIEIRDDLAPTLQKSEGLRFKASEAEVVVLYFEPLATQNLKSSGFPDVLGRSSKSEAQRGNNMAKSRPHPSISPMEVSKNLSFCYDICNNCGPLSKHCHVVYATKGLALLQAINAQTFWA
jgi:hypothetical protein